MSCIDIAKNAFLVESIFYRREKNKMKLGLIRHGSTAWNREGRAQGSSNIPLDKEGVDGARLLADRLCQDNWDVIYTSDLMRATNR